MSSHPGIDERSASPAEARQPHTTEGAMKLKLAVLSACLTSAVVSTSGQAIHSVPANSTGNQLVFTLVNESQKTSLQNVTVRSAKHSPAVTFRPERQFLKLLPPQKEYDVTFAFDVDRSAQLNTYDTLEFVITDKAGFGSRKAVIVTYTGPTTFAFEQNYPNPFNPTTTIQYQLPTSGHVSLKVYNTLGQEVATLVEEVQDPGFKSITFGASQLPSGVYFYRLQAGAFIQSKKMLLLK
jgi:hypothetical protein